MANDVPVSEFSQSFGLSDENMDEIRLPMPTFDLT